MCKRGLIRRYNHWISQQKIHPIWLELKEKEVQSKYDVWLRIHLQKMCIFACVAHWVYLVVSLGLNFG